MGKFEWCTATSEMSTAAIKMAIDINPLNNPVTSQIPINVSTSGTQTRQQALTGRSDKFWRPGSVLKVEFTNGSTVQRDRVMSIANQWCDHANIQFDAGDHPNPDIRITFGQTRNSSRIGTDSRLSINAGRNSMNFIDFSPDQGTILHEFGHALGLMHEHQNPQAGIKWDKDAVIAELSGLPNSWTKEEIEHNVFNNLKHNSLNYSQFDIESIMGYNISASWTTDGFSVARPRILSPTDISYIGDWYPFGGLQRPSRRPGSDAVRVIARGVSRRTFAKNWNGTQWQPAQEDWDLVLEDEISGHPGVSSWNPGDDALIVVREESGKPFFTVRERQSWSPWKFLGGGMTGSPTVLRTNTGEAYIFVRGQSGRPFYKRSSDGKNWNTSKDGWVSLGGELTGLIGAASDGDKIGLVVRGTSGRAFVKWWDGSKWHPGEKNWMNIDGAVTAQPAIAFHKGNLHIVIRTPGGEPQHRMIDIQNKLVSGPWRPLGGSIIGTPSLVHGQDNMLHLVVRGTSRGIFRKVWDGQKWTPGNKWESLGGKSVDSPTAVALPRTSQSGAQVQIFVTGVSHRGFRKIWDGTRWTPSGNDWESLGGNLA